MDYPKVYIIILNWNGPKDTLECLESVFKLDYPNFEVAVVDNGSIDNSVEVIRNTYPRVRLIENKENLGYAGGNNVGMRYALKNEADYVWLLNNDAVVEVDTLTKLVNTSRKCPQTGLISPIVYYYEVPEKIQFCGSYADLNNQKIVCPADKNLQIDGDFTNGENVCLWGTALLIKKEVIDRIGYLDEEFFAYWEDTEYSLRSIKAGFRNMIEPLSKVYHKNQSPETEVPNKGIYFYYFMTRNEYFLWMRYMEGLKKLIYFQKYLAKVIWNAADYRFYFGKQIADACFDGSWCALRGVRGNWNKNSKMPELLKLLFSWHPHFWKCLLECNFPYILSEVFKRSKKKILEIAG